MANDAKIKTDTFMNLADVIKQDFEGIFGRPLTSKDIAVVKADSPEYSGAFQVSAIDRKDFSNKVGNIFENEVKVVSVENLESDRTQNNIVKKPKLR